MVRWRLLRFRTSADVVAEGEAGVAGGRVGVVQRFGDCRCRSRDEEVIPETPAVRADPAEANDQLVNPRGALSISFGKCPECAG